MANCIYFSKLCLKKVHLILLIIAILPIIASCSNNATLELTESYDNSNIQIENSYPINLAPFEEISIIEEIAFRDRYDNEVSVKLLRCLNYLIYGLDIRADNSHQLIEIPFEENWQWQHTPHGLRVLENDTLVLRTRIPGDTANNESFDMIFRRSFGYYGRGFRTSISEFINVLGTMFYASLVINGDGTYMIEIYDNEFNHIQDIIFQSERGASGDLLHFNDLTNNGYGDIWLARHHGDTVSTQSYLIYKGYIWNIELQEFIEVEFIGFEWLVSPRYESGYIRDYTLLYIIDGIEHFNVRILAWEANQLILISEYVMTAE